MIIENKPWLVEFLRLISARPKGYLGTERVEELLLYITAYTSARSDLGVPEFGPGEEQILENFSKWMEERLEASDTRGWWGLVKRVDPSDRSVLTFLNLFSEFLSASDRAPLSERPIER